MLISIEKEQATKVKNMRNGENSVIVKKVVSGNKTFLRITILPEASIGYHTHIDDEEIVYVISGCGLGKEENKEYTLQAGDIIYIKNKEGHTIINNGPNNLEILGIIQK